MKKKIIIIITIFVLFLIGSFVGMVSSTSTEEEVNQNCTKDCEECGSKFNDSNNCNSQGNNICDGSGTCSQNKQRQGNCKSNLGCSGLCHK